MLAPATITATRGILMPDMITHTTRVITTIMAAITMTIMVSMGIIITGIPMLMTTAEPEGLHDGQMSAAEARGLYRLMTWLSPAFPVGGFSYSSGLEWAIEAADIV